jgi:hypothetical protein
VQLQFPLEETATAVGTVLILDLLRQTIRYFLVVDYWFEVEVHQAIIITEDHWALIITEGDWALIITEGHWTWIASPRQEATRLD